MIDLWFASKEDARKWENKHNFTILYRSADARPAREAPTADAIASAAKNQVGKEYVLNAFGPVSSIARDLCVMCLTNAA